MPKAKQKLRDSQNIIQMRNCMWSISLGSNNNLEQCLFSLKDGKMTIRQSKKVNKKVKKTFSFEISLLDLMERSKTMHKKAMSKGTKKISKVMKEFKEGKLHSGSKHGAKVVNPKQAIAISLSEARSAGAKIPKKKAKI